ncbi:MAG TPA: diaminopimelate epimerase [Acidimicrobiales bacterium]|nr:diaminopimelate epimerase [Acidimicrobiales bacterium]
MRLTKHHGLGNDFLVLLDRSGDQPLSPDQVRALCDRHRGIGADGVLRATPGPDAEGDAVDAVDAVMELRNADGTRAEMSGNGIRCLAQALLLAGWAEPPAVRILTDAGLRTITVHRPVDASTALLEVDMGPVRLEGDAGEWTGGRLRRATWANMGNPHLVVEVEVEGSLDRDRDQLAATIDLVALGEKVNATVEGGANVHLLTRGEGDGDRIAIRTYERGVGLTQACGTGACASAAVAHAWGLVGDHVAVDMPGGTAQVRLADTVSLVGPAALIATIDVADAPR